MSILARPLNFGMNEQMGSETLNATKIAETLGALELSSSWASWAWFRQRRLLPAVPAVVYAMASQTGHLIYVNKHKGGNFKLLLRLRGFLHFYLCSAVPESLVIKNKKVKKVRQIRQISRFHDFARFPDSPHHPPRCPAVSLASLDSSSSWPPEGRKDLMPWLNHDRLLSGQIRWPLPRLACNVATPGVPRLPGFSLFRSHWW